MVEHKLFAPLTVQVVVAEIQGLLVSSEDVFRLGRKFIALPNRLNERCSVRRNRCPMDIPLLVT